MITRRKFILSATTLLASLPLYSKSLGTQTPRPLRLALWPSLNGCRPDDFWPSVANLSSLSMVTEPLSDHKDQLLFVDGINMDGSYDHFAVRSMFTGHPINSYNDPDPTVKSFDQVVADYIQQTNPTPTKSIHLGVIPAEHPEFYQLYGRSTFFFRDGSPLDYEANPIAAYDSLFGSSQVQGAMSHGTKNYHTEDLLKILHTEVTTLRDQVRGYAQPTLLVKEHTKALEMFLAEHQNTTPTPVVSCGDTGLPSVDALRGELTNNIRACYNSKNFSAIYDAQIDIAAKSLICGQTRVVTIQAGSADGGVTVPVDGGYAHHPTSHDNAIAFSKCKRWYAQKFSRFLGALKVPDPLDPAHTVLDNSIILWLEECQLGHGSSRLPCIIAGGGGGRLATGQHLKISGTNKQLMATLCQVFNIPQTNYAHFGSQTLQGIVNTI